MAAYFRAIWKCRYFWLSLVKMDLRSRYRGSVMGMGWSLLHPIALTIILCSVFSTIFNADIRFYVPFLMAGLTCWNFVMSSSLQGCQCFFQGEAYIRQHPAPMAIYPLRTMLGSGFHFGLAMILVLLAAWGLRGFSNPLALLSLFPTIGLLLVLGWALATLFGLVNVRFRDTNHLGEIGFQTLFYLTPVMYTPDLLQNRHLGALLEWNPLMPFLSLLRQPILDGTFPSPMLFTSAAMIVLVVATAAGLLLRREERRLVFHL